MDLKLYLSEIKTIADQIDQTQVDRALDYLKHCKQVEGRLFILGNGGSAANASHAVNDFRKIANIEAYAPSDNVAELTAWTNDLSWRDVYSSWLFESHLCFTDVVMVLSVGGASQTTSANLVDAMRYAVHKQAAIISIVSRDGGMARELSTACILIPPLNEKTITPHAESWQAIIWHYLALCAAEEEGI